MSVLGVNLSDRLRFSEHISDVLQTCARSCYLFTHQSHYALSTPQRSCCYTCRYGYFLASDLSKIERLLSRTTCMGYLQQDCRIPSWLWLVLQIEDCGVMCPRNSICGST